MSKQSDAGPRGPLSRYAPGFGSELIAVGYSKSAAKMQLLLLGRLSRWLDDEDLDVDALATERSCRSSTPGVRGVVRTC